MWMLGYAPLNLFGGCTMVSRFKIQGIINFFFIFENKLDANRFLNNEPRSFDKYLIVLQYYKKSFFQGDIFLG